MPLLRATRGLCSQSYVAGAVRVCPSINGTAYFASELSDSPKPTGRETSTRSLSACQWQELGVRKEPDKPFYQNSYPSLLRQILTMEDFYTRENAIRRSLSDFSLPKQLKLRLGKLLLPIFPGRIKAVEDGPFASDGRLHRLLRNGLYARALERGDFASLRSFLSKFWGQEAKNFHDAWQDRFERMFLKHDVVVIDELEKVMANLPDGKRFDHLYEIGCGGGQVLSYLVERLSGIGEFAGIDLGKEQIEANLAECQNPKMSFHAADAVEWIPANAKPFTVVLTNGGVFEYFLREELQSLFEHIATQLAPAAVAVVETIGSDHDLDAHPETFVYGRELSFSHNYPHLLREAGFEIVHQSERTGYEVDGGGRWLRVLATKLS